MQMICFLSTSFNFKAAPLGMILSLNDDQKKQKLPYAQ